MRTAATKSSKRFQFSLREFVLLITALAAILALVVSRRARRVSEFAQQFEPKALVEKIIRQEGLGGSTFGSHGGSASGTTAIQKEATFVLRGLDEQQVRRKVMPALRKEVLDAISKERFALHQVGTSGERPASNKPFEEISNFSFDYNGSRIRGIFRAVTGFTKDSEPTIYILLDES